MPLPNPRAGDAEVQRNFRRLEHDIQDARNLFSAGTIFPTSPNDGQFFIYNADTTNGVKWMFQYRTASSSAYKWELVGGRPLRATVETDQTTTSTSYDDLTTTGPSITTPLAGDYDVHIGCFARSEDAVAYEGWMSYAVGGTAASDADAASNVSSGQYDGSSITSHRRKSAIAASTALVSKYKTQIGANDILFSKRWMEITPVRVSS